MCFQCWIPTNNYGKMVWRTKGPILYHYLLLKLKLLVLQFARSFRSSSRSLYQQKSHKTKIFFFPATMFVTENGVVYIYLTRSCYLKCILTSIFTLKKVALPSAKSVNVSQILVLTTIKNRTSNTSKNILAHCLSHTRLINFFYIWLLVLR